MKKLPHVRQKIARLAAGVRGSGLSAPVERGTPGQNPSDKPNRFVTMVVGPDRGSTMDKPSRKLGSTELAALFGVASRAMPSKTSWETELEMVSRHVCESDRRIARQHQIIADLRAKNRSTVLAEDILVLLEESQALHEAHLKRLTAN